MNRLHISAVIIMIFASACLCFGGEPPIKATVNRASVSLKKTPYPTFSEYNAKISFACDIMSTQRRIKKPLVLFIFLRQDEGTWRYNACLAQDSALTAKIRKASDITVQSAKQVEVDLQQYRRFQVAGEQAWMFRSPGNNSILAFRCELWIDGTLAGVFDSLSVIKAKQMGIPEDWYVEGKYPEKILYGRIGTSTD